MRHNQDLVQNFYVDDANQLNQITRSDTLTVTGTYQGANVGVTVNGQTAVLNPSDHTFAAAGMAATNGVNIYTAIASDGAGHASTNTVTVNLPATVSFQYDNNGNLTSDGLRSFYYDDANQLISVMVANSWKAEFVYDGLGRRRITRDYGWSAPGYWNLTNEVRYLYDGNLVVQERDGNNQPLAAYTRGLDLSGSLDGTGSPRQSGAMAGGIGGLLARSLSYSVGTWATNLFYHSDGNGNVTYLMNSGQTKAASYQYDPYGFLLTADGDFADGHPYRFSSREFHVNSGLYYFGFRYYDPNLQRWLSQDPIEELGGLNLYGFVGNEPINAVDPYGLEVGYRYEATGMHSPLDSPGSYKRMETALNKVIIPSVDAAFWVMDKVDESIDTLRKSHNPCNRIAGTGLLAASWFWGGAETKAFRKGRKFAKGAASLIPESYMNARLLVNMEPARGLVGSTLNAGVQVRNADYFWRLLIEREPPMFSKGNLYRIQELGLSPRVDATWVEYNPTHRRFMNEVLAHHHVGQGPVAVPLPQTLHERWTSLLHRN